MIFHLPLSDEHIQWIEKRLHQEIAVYVRQKAVGTLAQSEERKLEVMQSLKGCLDARHQKEMKPQLFSKDEAPRRPNRKLMHVVDSGTDSILLECVHCTHSTGWVKATETLTYYKRGVPCPKCNTSGNSDGEA